MPIIKSAKKRVEIAAKRNLQNRMIKKNLSTAIKEYEGFIANKDVENASKKLSEVFSKLDEAVSSNTIHINNASKKKASLSVKLDRIKQAPKA